MRPSEEFQNELTAVLNTKAGNKQLALWDGLVDKLIEMLIGLFDQCIGSLSPAQVASRMAEAKSSDRVRFRSRVRKNIYKDSDDYKKQGGQAVADSVFDVTSKMGATKCEALVKEMTEGENWWPDADLFMG